MTTSHCKAAKEIRRVRQVRRVSYHVGDFVGDFIGGAGGIGAGAVLK